MNIRSSAVVKICVGLPDQIQHLDVNRHFLHRTHELQSFIHPRLTKVCVQRKGLEKGKLPISVAELTFSLIL